MIYIASPYTHDEPAIRAERYVEVMKFTVDRMRKGEPVYSPIVHCHHLAIVNAMPTDAKFWQDYNEAFIRISEVMYVLQIDGWKTSVGVGMEMDLCEQINIPVLGFTPLENGEYSRKELFIPKGHFLWQQ